MPQVARLLFGVEQFVAMTLLAVIYVRGFLPMKDMLGKGPFTGVVDTATVVIPVVIGAYYLFVALFVIAGPVQEERTASRRVRRR